MGKKNEKSTYFLILYRTLNSLSLLIIILFILKLFNISHISNMYIYLFSSFKIILRPKTCSVSVVSGMCPVRVACPKHVRLRKQQLKTGTHLSGTCPSVSLPDTSVILVRNARRRVRLQHNNMAQIFFLAQVNSKILSNLLYTQDHPRRISIM